MKIAYLCADFGIPILGYKGASVHVRELAAALMAQGHDVRIFSPNQGAGNDLHVPLHDIGAASLSDAAARLVRRAGGRRYPRLDKETRELAYNLTLYRRTRSLLRTWHPDVVYERYSLFNLAGLALAHRLGVPHLLEVNAPLRLERARTKGLTLAPLAGWVERTLFDGSDAVLVVSDALRRYVLKHSGGAVRVVVRPNAVDVQRFVKRGSGLEMRARLGLASDAIVVGFAGSLKPWHGVGILLDAFATLHSHEPASRLLIIGEGPQDVPMRARAAALGLGASVLFTGRVAHAEMPGLLACMDVGVAPYLRVPDFYFSPLKLYEYMAAGLAVVASDVGDMASLIRDGETGLMCPPGDTAALASALLLLARNPGQRTRLGAAARAQAERHTWAENARVVADLATSIHTARSGRRAYRHSSVEEFS